MLSENIQLVSMEERLRGKLFQGCFKVYPHCFYLSLFVLALQGLLGMMLVLWQTPVLGLKNFGCQVLTSKNQTHVDVQQDATLVNRSLCFLPNV